MSKYITALVWAAVLFTTMSAQEPIVIEGRVVDATEKAETPPRDSVVVWYEEYGIDHEPVFTRTGEKGKFKLNLPGNLGKLGLLSVREPEYNSAVRRWPAAIDRDLVLRLTKPIPIYGRVVNASGLAVSGTMLKWRMAHDGRLTSGVVAAAPDGSFDLLVPSKSDALRLVAWAHLYAPTEADFSYNASEKLATTTTLRTLEDMRPGGAAAQIRDEGDQYLQDWIDEILSQEPVAEPAPPR